MLDDGAAFFLAGCVSIQSSQPEHRTVYLVWRRSPRVDINVNGRTAVLRDTNGERLILKAYVHSGAARYEGGGVAILRADDLFVYYTRGGQSLDCAPLGR